MPLSQQFPSLGFLGAGNMAGAILRAVIGKRLIDPKLCSAVDVYPEKTNQLAADIGIRIAASAEELFDTCTSIVLATKPQDLLKALGELAPRVTPQHRIISIAAGIRAAAIEKVLPAGTRVVRVMPNTPAMIGEGAAGIAAGTNATAADVKAVVALFESVGYAAEVKEQDLDAITALSGSGPAYVFRFMEIIEQAGVEMGLAPELARMLTLQTFLGASKLALQSEDTPTELRKKVTSPGGTTAAALNVFEDGGIEELLKKGVHRARERSLELAS